MAGSELGHRLSEFRSRFSLSDRKTNLTLASIASLIVIILAVIALPGSGKKATSTTTDNGAQAPGSALPGETSAAPTSTSASTGGSHYATVNGNVPNAPATFNGLTAK